MAGPESAGDLSPQAINPTSNPIRRILPPPTAAYFVALALAGCGKDERPNKTDVPNGGTPTGTITTTGTPALPPVFESEVLLAKRADWTQIGNIRLADLDYGPGLELALAEASPPGLTWLGCQDGACLSEELLVPMGARPVRTATADMDQDGDADLVVASVGELQPTNLLVGSVWIYLRGPGGFTPELVIDTLPRTVCAEPGDLDGDGDLDLTLCAFGHTTVGHFGWLEKDGNTFTEHVLDPRPGAIHGFPVDVDGDGDLDIVAGMAQLTEAVILHRNDGAGNFTLETLVDKADTWFGLSGIEPTDLDLDGDIDLLLTNGDTMDGDLPDGVDPNDAHAVRWLENDGAGKFTETPLFFVWGAYTVRAADMDGDGDQDVMLGNFLNTRNIPDYEPPSELYYLENDGSQQFTPYEVAGAAPQLISIELGDVDQDGDLDVFGGSMAVDSNQTSERMVLLTNVATD